MHTHTHTWHIQITFRMCVDKCVYVDINMQICRLIEL